MSLAEGTLNKIAVEAADSPRVHLTPSQNYDILKLEGAGYAKFNNYVERGSAARREESEGTPGFRALIGRCGRGINGMGSGEIRGVPQAEVKGAEHGKEADDLRRGLQRAAERPGAGPELGEPSEIRDIQGRQQPLQSEIKQQRCIQYNQESNEETRKANLGNYRIRPTIELSFPSHPQ